MRFISACVILLTLAACSGSISAEKAVDSANLAPLTSKEQALIFGADGAMQQGNYVAAERDYLTAIAASTGHVEAHIKLARLYDKQHFPEKEAAILKQALELQPIHPAANYMLGKIHLNANRYSEALDAFRKGRSKNYSDVDLAVGEGISLDMLGQHEVAQSIYKRVLNDDAKARNASVRTNLGMSYLLSGEPKKTIEVLKVEAKKADASQVSRHNLALAYGMLGRTGDAKAILKGDLDEETRQLAVARMKEYVKQRQASAVTQPKITPAEVIAPVKKN